MGPGETGPGERGEEEDDWQLRRYAADMKMDKGPTSQSRGSFPIKPSTFMRIWPLFDVDVALQGCTKDSQRR
jgi:hypothetical protein